MGLRGVFRVGQHVVYVCKRTCVDVCGFGVPKEGASELHVEMYILDFLH